MLWLFSVRKLLACYVLSVYVLRFIYEYISPSLCWTVSNKPSDSQSDCSQRVQPQALLPHTCTHTDTSARVKEGTGFCSVYTGRMATILLEYYPPVFLSTPPPSSIYSLPQSPLSSAVSMSLFHTSSSSVCPTSLPHPPHFSLFSISRFTAKPRHAAALQLNLSFTESDTCLRISKCNLLF